MASTTLASTNSSATRIALAAIPLEPISKPPLLDIRPGSLRLDAGEPHHLRPLLGFRGNEPGEVVGRTGKDFAAQIDKPRLERGIGEAGIDLPVERDHDVGRRFFRRADPEPCG